MVAGWMLDLIRRWAPGVPRRKRDTDPRPSAAGPLVKRIADSLLRSRISGVLSSAMVGVPECWSKYFPTVNPAEVRAVYCLEGETAVPVDDQRMQLEWFEEDGGVGWKVELHSKNEQITKEFLPLTRVVWMDRSFLNSSGSGIVAENQLFCLETKFQNKRLGTALHKREFALFKKLGAQEIQLTAGCEAKSRFTWFKFGFALPDDTLQALQCQFESMKNGKSWASIAWTSNWKMWPDEFKEHVSKYTEQRLYMPVRMDIP